MKTQRCLNLEESGIKGKLLVSVKEFTPFLDELWKVAQKEALKLGKLTKRVRPIYSNGKEMS
jgi:hypothetical protein